MTRPLRIGIACYPTYGGSGVMATELGLALADRGHDVHLFSYERPMRLPYLVALLAILLLCYVVMLVAIPIQRLLGITGLAVVSRVVGVLLAALAVQFLLDGLKSSGLIPGLAG